MGAERLFSAYAGILFLALPCQLRAPTATAQAASMSAGSETLGAPRSTDHPSRSAPVVNSSPDDPIPRPEHGGKSGRVATLLSVGGTVVPVLAAVPLVAHSNGPEANGRPPDFWLVQVS